MGGIREIATPGADALIAPGDDCALVAEVLRMAQQTERAKRVFEPDDLAAMAGRFCEVLNRARAGSQLRTAG